MRNTTDERMAYYWVNERGFANTGYYQAVPLCLVKIFDDIAEAWTHCERTYNGNTNAIMERVSAKDVRSYRAWERRTRRVLPNDIYRGDIESYTATTLDEFLADIGYYNFDYLKESTLDALRDEGVDIDYFATC